MERKKLLEEIIREDSGLVAKVKYIEGHGSPYFNLVQQQGLEGVVLKRKDSQYEVGKRSKAWLKVINYQFEDVLISVLFRYIQVCVGTFLRQETQLSIPV